MVEIIDLISDEEEQPNQPQRPPTPTPTPPSPAAGTAPSSSPSTSYARDRGGLARDRARKSTSRSGPASSAAEGYRAPVPPATDHGAGPSAPTQPAPPPPSFSHLEFFEGCVPERPNLLHGEDVFLSMTYCPQALALVEAEQRQWAEGKLKLLAREEVIIHARGEDEEDFKKQLQVGVCKELELSPSHPIKEGWQVPSDFPLHTGLEAFQIPDNDPRKALRGGLGVRLRKGSSLKKGDIIGAYAGFVLESVLGLRVCRSVPKHFEVGRPQHERVAMWRLQFERYALDAVTVTGTSLAVSAAGYGNLTALMNDPHIDPVQAVEDGCYLDRHLEDDDAARARLTDLPSVEVIICSVRGYVLPLCVALRDMTGSSYGANSELTYTYGAAYWDNAESQRLSCPTAGKSTLQSRLEAVREALRVKDDAALTEAEVQLATETVADLERALRRCPPSIAGRA